MKKFIYGISLLLCFLIPAIVLAQHQEVSERPEMYKGRDIDSADSRSVLGAFKSGRVQGHFRYFNMITLNEKDLSDYYANAAGGGLRFETAKFHNFQFGISGFYIFNIGSSDMTIPDPKSGQYNRYEIGLFDLQNASNKKDIDRLEELYLKYNYKKSALIFGRQLLNTPFINLQDGRMRPTGVEGLWAEINDIKGTKIEGGWLYGISPRSTNKWFGVGETIGIYSAGLNPDGTPSLYSGQIHSNGVALVGVTRAINKKIKLQGWNMFTDNVFNTAMLQTDLSFPLKGNSTLMASAQIIRQDAINNGGNENQAETYFSKGASSLSFGTKFAWKMKRLETSLNYNRITAQGRYLVPREWGRDPFFTFLPRERNEGFGDLDAIMAKVNYSFPKSGIKTSLAAGYYHLPDTKNYALNKYGMPSYTQINTDIRYTFTNTLKGLEAQLLLVAKLNNGETYGNSRLIINKVNMIQSNFVLNFHF
jgi:hypothetical protein